PADGVAMYVGWIAGFGRVLILDHGGGLSTVYAHLSSIVVRVGQRIKVGQIIAYTGTSGLSTGPHLHFEVRVNGKPVNPLVWLRRR
ncbi:MAG: M23 family metallopeptidase, partial [Synergistetes bacterium]|nr:M23 family metallopeptidase [Synergistota bacterium]